MIRAAVRIAFGGQRTIGVRLLSDAPTRFDSARPSWPDVVAGGNVSANPTWTPM
jgi:hypothetical protein